MIIKIKKVYDFPDDGTHPTTILSVKEVGLTDSKFEDKQGNKLQRDTLEIVFQIDDQFAPEGEPIQYVWMATASVMPAAPRRGIKASNLYRLLKALDVQIGSEFNTDELIGRQPLVRFEKKDVDGKTKVVITGFPKTMAHKVEEVEEVDDVLDDTVPARMQLWDETDLPVATHRNRAKTLLKAVEIIERFQDQFDVEIRALKQGGFALDFVPKNEASND